MDHSIKSYCARITKSGIYHMLLKDIQCATRLVDREEDMKLLKDARNVMKEIAWYWAGCAALEYKRSSDEIQAQFYVQQAFNKLDKVHETVFNVIQRHWLYRRREVLEWIIEKLK